MTKKRREIAEELFRHGSMMGGFREETYKKFLIEDEDFTEEEANSAIEEAHLQTLDGVHFILSSYFKENF